jgi:predicted amidophosphoribosyltransferase
VVNKYGKMLWSEDENRVCERCVYPFHFNNEVCKYCLHNTGDHYYYSDEPMSIEETLTLLRDIVTPKQLELIKEVLHGRLG